MRTVATLCATGAGISLSAVGLTLARRDNDTDMTAVASSYNTLPLASTRPTYFDQTSQHSFSAPSTRLARLGDNGRASSSSTTRQKRSFGLGVEAQTAGDDGNLSQAGTPVSGSKPRSWLRRLSSTMSSRETSRTPTSRPGSSAISISNGSLAFSHTGSTTPIFSENTPPAAQPNKLVKRTSSLRSSNGSPFPSPGSRLPLPVFRRPATSHQRSATVPESFTDASTSDRMSIDQKSDSARDRSWQLYFTARAARDDQPFGRRRSSTGIPNPIKRLYPDRKYTPILVSAKELVKVADVEVDDGLSIDDESTAVTRLQMVPSVASSPMPTFTAQFEESNPPRRSFSIGDLLSTGPQPLWKRPSSSKGKASGKRFSRKPRSRVVSAPLPSMGSTYSSATANDGERPAKRRDISDPQAGHRSIYSSSGSIPTADQQQHEVHLGLGSTTPLSQHFSVASPLAETPPPVVTPSPLEQRRLPSATDESAAARQARVSATQSEITTSTLGSDSEQRSVGGYSTDNESGTVFDSFPTRTTRSSSGKRGPPIDTIFDESPPSFSSGRSTKLRDLLGDGYFPTSEHSTRYRHSTIEEEESVISTPVRSLHDKSLTSTPSARPGAQQIFASSPPAMSLLSDPDEIDWDAPDEPVVVQQGLGIHRQLDTPAKVHQGARVTPFRLSAFARSGDPTSVHSTPNRYTNGGADRANPFDWSEQQPSPSQNHSPPRPRTVHGKKDPENRGSRSAGRRAPSGIHARSHSVPVVPDVDGKRSVVANKFGTWGVGSKGVTEDWNEDFDFEEAPPPLPETSTAQDEKRIDSGHEMFVPKSIREQQENVVANIGLLREWGLLIEELKALRIRAVALDMLNGPYAKAWQEVDAMIELADQESEEETLQPRRSPPSSPGFDYDDFDDPAAEPATAGRERSDTVRLSKATTIDEEHDFLTPPPHTTVHPGTLPLTVRPRKDSEAVARSVIEALQTKRSVSDPTAMHLQQPAKKVPFDTATLRHIVPYVNGLKRKVKDALRETEGLYSSPRRRGSPDQTMSDRDESDEEPAFRSIFNEPGPDSPTSKGRQRREAAATDNDGWDIPTNEQRNDLASRIERMTLSPT